MDDRTTNALGEYAGKRVLVTGGLGMIGSHAATAATELGAQVVVLDSLLSDHGGNRANLAGFESDIEVRIADIRDRAAVEDAVRGQDIIIHCAAHVCYPDSMKDPFLDLDINGRGHLTLLEACRYHNDSVKIVFTSSRMKYGSVDVNPVKETQPAAPLMFYGAHKLLGEKYHEIYYRNYGLRYSNLVVPNPYGPRQQMQHHRYGLVNWFIRTAMEDGEITIFGEGDQVRDYIYVEDIVQAILLCAIRDEATGETINLGNGEGTSFKTMVETVVDAVGSGSYKHVEWPENYFNIETGDYIADISKAAALGYSPDVPFKEGVARTVQFYRERRSDYW